MLNNDQQRCANIIKAIKALIPDCGEVVINKTEFENTIWSTPPLKLQSSAYFIYIENANIAKSFWSLDELEQYVIRQIHGLKLLTVTTPSPEARRRKIAQRWMVGEFNREEMN